MPTKTCRTLGCKPSFFCNPFLIICQPCSLRVCLFSRFLISPSDVDLAARGQKGEEPFACRRVRHHHRLDARDPFVRGDVDRDQPAARTQRRLLLLLLPRPEELVVRIPALVYGLGRHHRVGRIGRAKRIKMGRQSRDKTLAVTETSF